MIGSPRCIFDYSANRPPHKCMQTSLRGARRLPLRSLKTRPSVSSSSPSLILCLHLSLVSFLPATPTPKFNKLPGDLHESTPRNLLKGPKQGMTHPQMALFPCLQIWLFCFFFPLPTGFEIFIKLGNFFFLSGKINKSGLITAGVWVMHQNVTKSCNKE